MAQEVLLMADVEDLGSEGDVVKVADGYARNCLFPGKLAAPVTEATRRRLAKIQENRVAELKDQLAAANERKAGLENVSVTIPVKVGEGEKMYGSVHAADIIKALEEQGVILDKNELALEEPIKDLGVFDVPVKIHPEVEAQIKVWIVEE